MTAHDITEAELRHDLDSLAFQFEARLRRSLPADGSAADVFEDWRDALYGAFDHPNDDSRGEAAEDALMELMRFLP